MLRWSHPGCGREIYEFQPGNSLQIGSGNFHRRLSCPFGSGHVSPEVADDRESSNGFTGACRFPEGLHNEKLAIEELDELVQRRGDLCQEQKGKEEISQEHRQFLFQRAAALGDFGNVPKCFSKSSQSLGISGSRFCLEPKGIFFEREKPIVSQLTLSS